MRMTKCSRNFTPTASSNEFAKYYMEDTLINIQREGMSFVGVCYL